MNAIGVVFTLVAGALLATLPRRLAAIPLLLSTLYMTRGQILELGAAHFTVVQILGAVGMVRAVSKGEAVTGGMNCVDRLLILWAIWLVGSSAFHTADAWVFRIGVVWNDLCCYFLFRCFIQDGDDIKRIFKVLCVALVPLAMLMLLEKAVGKNYFAVLGGVSEIPTLRNGHLRAQGPFAHAILAGVVGATCFPMALYLWQNHGKRGLVGLVAAGGVIFASTSSGPVMMLLFILFGIALWKVSAHLNTLRWLSLIAVIGLNAVMADPVYFLMAKIDISGGSTGWHRARLIQSSIEHLDEWWLAGTDYTRHWMATGIYANNRHTDITNHFLGMGVMGGLPLILIFIGVLVGAFHHIGKALRENENAPAQHRFLIWTLGAILFGHVWNFFSISLFDQSIVFFYFILASIGAVQAAKPLTAVEAKPSTGRIKQFRYATVKANKDTGNGWATDTLLLGAYPRLTSGMAHLTLKSDVTSR